MHQSRSSLLILVDLTVLQIPGNDQSSRRSQAHALAHAICSAINRLVVHFDSDVQFSYQTVQSSHPHLFHSQTVLSPQLATYNALDALRKHLLRQVSAVLNRPMYNSRLAPIAVAAQSLLTANGEPSYDSFLDESDHQDDHLPTLVIFGNPSVNEAQFSAFAPSTDEASASSGSRPKTLLPQQAKANIVWVDCSKSSNCLPAFRTWLSSQSANLVSLQSLTIDRRVIPAHVAIKSVLRPTPVSSVCSVDLVTVTSQEADHGKCGLLFRARLSSIQTQSNLSAQTVLIVKHFIENPTNDSLLAREDSVTEPPLIVSPFSGGGSSLDDTSKDQLWAENFLGLMATLAQTRCQLVVEMYSIDEGHCNPPHFAVLSPMTPMSAILRKVGTKLIANNLTSVSDTSPFIEWQSAMLNGHVLALSGERSGLLRYPTLCTSIFEPPNPANDPTEQKRQAASTRDQNSVAEAVDFKQKCISRNTSTFLQERLRVVKAAKRRLLSAIEKKTAKSKLLESLRKRLDEDNKMYLENAPQALIPWSPQHHVPSRDDVTGSNSEDVEISAEAKVSQPLDPVLLSLINTQHNVGETENSDEAKVSQLIESLQPTQNGQSSSALKLPSTPRLHEPLPIASVEEISEAIPPSRPTERKYRFEASVQRLDRGVNVSPRSPIVVQSSGSEHVIPDLDENSREGQDEPEVNSGNVEMTEENRSVSATSPGPDARVVPTAHEDSDDIKPKNSVVDVKPSSSRGVTCEKAVVGTNAECDSPLEILLEAADMKERSDHLLQLARDRELKTWNDTEKSDVKSASKNDAFFEDEEDLENDLDSKSRVESAKNASSNVKQCITKLLQSEHARGAVRNCLCALAHLASVLSTEGRVSSQVRRMVKSHTADEMLDASVCKDLQSARTRMRVQSGWMVDNDLSVGQWGAIMGALEVVVWLSAAATFGLRKRRGHKRVKRLSNRVQMIVSCVQVCGELSGASKETTELYQECLQQLFGSILSPFTEGWKGKPAEWLLDIMQEYGSRNLLVTPDKSGKRPRDNSIGIVGESADNAAGSIDCDNISPSSHKRARHDSWDDVRERKVVRARFEDGSFDGKKEKSTPRTSIKEIAEILKERKEERKLAARTRFASVENRIHGGGTLNRLAIKPEVNKSKKRDKRKERSERKEKQERVDAFLRELHASRRDDSADELGNEAGELDETEPVHKANAMRRFALDESALNLVERYDEGVDSLFEQLPPDTPEPDEGAHEETSVAGTPVD